MISQKRAHSVTPLPKRIEAYTYLQQMMKSGHLSRHEMVTTVTGEFGVSQQTVYSWFHGQTPYGERAGRISRRKELLYVLGALLGDGCIYFWKNVYQVWLVGEEEFASKFANKISSCVGRKVSSYPYRGRNVWFVLISNAELYFLFKSVRENTRLLMQLVSQGNPRLNALQLIEGFFDAEGCIKIIKGPERKTPKICLDITNTEIRFQHIMRTCIKQVLGIDTSLLSQRDRRLNRKIVYHLRIYRKRDIETFFKFIHTTKMKPEKSEYVEKWLGKRREDSGSTLEHSPDASPHHPN